MLSEGDMEVVVRELGRKPTLVEEFCFFNLWSEHCAYRSSRGLLKSFDAVEGQEAGGGKLRPQVFIGPGDDAAVISLDGETVLSIAMESHNHPSYVDPYNGAATGVGGIVRDVLSMGTRPVALMDALYFGPLDGEKNRFLFEKVVEGIAGYGNCIGVPVVRGEVVFHAGYSGNPLVNVVCIGLGRKRDVVTAVAQRAGSKIVLLGSSTGRDGLGGASFASRDLTGDVEERGSVQIGDPYTEKLLIDAVLEAIGEGVVLSCRDLGAAGLVGASCEMAANGGLGARINLDCVHLREEGMEAWEILVSESQERMLLEVERGDVERVLEIARRFDLEARVVGEFTGDGRYQVEFKGEVVVDVPAGFLAGGAPLIPRKQTPPPSRARVTPGFRLESLKEDVLGVISSPGLASKEWVYRQYDHEVQLRTVVKPGGDAAVLRLDKDVGLALSCGCNPLHSLADPYHGSSGAVFENALNLAVVGASPVALVDCLNFGSPEKPENYWQLAESIRGISEMARKIGVPVVGGNVSLYNDSVEFDTSIPPTPSLGMVGILEDIRRVPGHVFAGEGEAIFLLGETREELGGSYYYQLKGGSGPVPRPPENPMEILEAVTGLIRTGRITAAHDISTGGLVTALWEMTPQMGCEIELGTEMREDLFLFSETHGRVIFTTREPEKIPEMLSIPCQLIGWTGGEDLKLKVNNLEIRLTREEMDRARGGLTRTMSK